MKKTKILYICLLLVSLFLTGCCIQHDYSAATCTVPPTCSKCGKVEGDVIPHSFTPATCLEPETCEICGYQNGSALGHDFGQPTCTEAALCSRCGAVDETAPALGHTPTEATCTEPSVCEVCGEVLAPELGHKPLMDNCGKSTTCRICFESYEMPDHEYSAPTCTEPAICIVCGQKEGKPQGHDLSSNGICRSCGAEPSSKEYIAGIIGLKSKPETDKYSCMVDTDDTHNPYDLCYEYGDFYNALVEICDWKKVFDAEYYKKQFPMLALLYNYNDELLLEHFQTVGIHEGRQGSENFNVDAYRYNAYDKLNDVFEDNYECYYFYYLLNYDEENNTDSVKRADGNATMKQMKIINTYAQAEELKGINDYRRDVGVAEVQVTAELNAIANYRAYINQVEGWHAHDWAIQNNSIIYEWMAIMGSSSYGENEIESRSDDLIVGYKEYYKSDEHRETMLKDKFRYVGLSNTYYGKKYNSGGKRTYTFDIYFTNGH